MTASIIPPIREQQRKFYELDPEKLQDLWHTAMVRGLIKSYTKPLLDLLPHMEKVVYGVCIREAATTVALAKCAARVFDMRDNVLQRTRIPSSTTSMPASNSTKRKPTRRRFNRKKLAISKLSKPLKLRKLRDYLKHLHRSRKRTRFSRMHRRGRRAKRATRILEEKEQPVASRALENIIGIVGGKVRSQLENLRVINEHYRRVDECNKFFQRMNDQNRRFFEELNLGIDSRTPELENKADPVMQSVLETINAFAMVTTNRRQQNMILDVIMDVSGAGRTIESMMIKLKPEMDDVRYVKLPLVRELSRRRDRWMRYHLLSIYSGSGLL
ncbi:hypothetical protein OESDEN_06700 [Oesophagostomum dentatum]|uniref:Uncharacterized protein n=1 Tax=Oesophagostomum dentatum TaxID=61180 RepID=A0A0B1TC24_OESDE|nr:hypothetical protein OESDEN_06700 [Oesophagostomum dentatum]